MAYFPFFLELRNLPCLAIGGGQVAFAKVKSLLSCGAKVTVVSPQLVTGLKGLTRQKQIRWRRGRFRSSDLNGVQVVVAATDDQAVNELASRLAKRKGVLINVVDQPALCSFIFPSVVRRGKLVIAISTGGVSPGLSKWIRKDLQRRYGPELGDLLKKMARVRDRIKRKIPSYNRRKKLLEKALAAYFQVVREGIQ